MDCQRILQDLSLLLDGELEARTEREARQHLQDCPGCRATLQDLEKNRDLLAGLPRLALPEGLFGRVMDEVGRAGPRPRAWPRSSPTSSRRWGWRFLVAAAVLLMLGLGGLTILGYYSDEPGLDVAGSPLVNRHALDSGAPLMGEPPLWMPASYVPGELEVLP